MKPTKILREEHELILVMLGVIGAVCRRLERRDKVEYDHLGLIIDFLQKFIDGCHHAKEENALFPALEAVGISREGGAIGALLLEHAAGRKMVKSMDEAVGKIRGGDPDAAGGFMETAREYADFLSNHIHKGNNILFSMVDQRITKVGKRNVIMEFDRIEREETGEGVHEKYHEILHGLRDAYLK